MLRLTFRILLGLFALLSGASTANALTLSGTLTSNGQPFRYGRVYVSGLKKPIRTDKAGAFSVTVSTPGSYTLTPYLRSNRFSVPFNRVVTVGSSDIAGLNFAISQATDKALLFGRITDKSRAPLPNVAVYISGYGPETTDANGIFSRNDLAPGRYALTAIAQRATFSPALRQVTAKAGRGFRTQFRSIPLESGMQVATYLSGSYNVALSRTSGQCSTLPNSINGSASIIQRLDKVRISLPSIGAATICATANGFAGDFARNRMGCSASGNLQATYTSQDRANLTGQLQIICPGVSNCTGTFAGTLQRQ